MKPLDTPFRYIYLNVNMYLNLNQKLSIYCPALLIKEERNVTTYIKSRSKYTIYLTMWLELNPNMN